MLPPSLMVFFLIDGFPKELKKLSNSREEYLKFFSWKAKTEVVNGYSQMGCSLCKALHESKPDKTYQDLGDWWRHGGNCQS